MSDRYSTQITQRARRLRRESTLAERHLWSQIRGRQLAGLKFRRQEPIGPYVADFLCLEHRLVVELDGEEHDEPKQVEHDLHRDEYLRDRDFRVLLFPNEMVFENCGAVLRAICAACGVEPTGVY